ncbi:MAG: ABC transporter ATP-binding protein [Oscillospiraceae bacterium]|nr:ABC transporter ATP-binding protein [Oscillospiraceae bacterium]
MELKAEGVSRRYFRQGTGKNYFYAVEEANLCLTGGSLTVITGRSGSGKSTLLNILAGLLEPTAGQVFLDDVDLYRLSDAERSRVRNRKIGVIPQGHTGLHSLTVMENVQLPGLMYGKSLASEERAETILGRVGIAHLKNAYPGELSGGELRRLSIARALIMEPLVLLADEPTGDLDDENTDLVLQLLRESANDGMAVLLVTHERDAAHYADECYRMGEGILRKET